MEERGLVVIGAGPGGSSAAKTAAETGQDVLLIEKDRYAGERTVCGGGLEPPFAQRLAGRFPSGVVDKYMTDWLIYPPLRHNLPDRTYYASNVLGMSFQRCIFDRFLAEDAARSGADLRVQTVATDVKQNAEGVTVRLRDRQASREYEVRSRLVIFADGPKTLAQKFGLGFPRTRPDVTAHAAIYELEWKNNPLNCFEFFLDRQIPWGYGWVFPKKDVLNVGVGCLMSRMTTNIKAYLDYFVEESPFASRNLRSLKKVRFAADIIPVAHASHIVGDNMMVVGDAAGMVDPIWGGGIGHAISGGTIAGEVASRALDENRVDSTFLKQFERKWKRTSEYRDLRLAFLGYRLFLRFSRFDDDAFYKFMKLAGWSEGMRIPRLGPEQLREKGVIGVATMNRSDQSL
jgi:digeranylgeranylglycerophospholipid reductase